MSIIASVNEDAKQFEEYEDMQQEIEYVRCPLCGFFSYSLNIYNLCEKCEEEVISDAGMEYSQEFE